MRLTRSEAQRLRHAVARIDEWLELATPEDLASGLGWYDRAREEATSLAYLPGCGSVKRAAGVIAALSPRCQWGANVNGAHAMIRAAVTSAPEPIVAGIATNRARAWRIANGEDPDAVLSGPKVRAFFANIMGDVDAVTVDVWATRAATGRTDRDGLKRRRYRLIAESYRRAGARRGLHPRDAQAAVWTVYRRTYGYAYDPR